MRYLGGKERISFTLLKYMQPYIDKATAYVEPFVGGASIICRVHHKKRVGSDLNEALINLYKELQNGWIPPIELSEETYQKYYKNRDPKDPMTAFCGFGCSFGGMWFHGYARNSTGTNYALSTRNSLLRKHANLKDVQWLNGSYKDISIEDGSFVYCDPPYENTFGYEAVEKFSHEEFWEWARDLSKRATVFVSEYKAPEDINLVWSRDHRLAIRTNDPTKMMRIECLFTPNEITDLQLRKTKPIGLLSRKARI